MSARWSRLTLRAQKDRWGGTHTMLCTALPGYQPGEEVVVMPAGDADAMLAILGRVGHMVPKLIQPSKLEQDAYALHARLSPGPGEQVARPLCASCDSPATRRDADGHPRCNLCGPITPGEPKP